MMNYIEEQEQEFEALKAIYNEDFTDLLTKPFSCMVTLKIWESDSPTSISLKFTLPDDYPEAFPVIEVPLRKKNEKFFWRNKLIDHLKTVAEQNHGYPSIYAIVEEGREWLKINSKQENFDYSSQSTTNDNDDLKEVDLSIDLLDISSASSQGKWDFVIGLVGKPSSGKSTFFNAATKCNLAKVAPHPFTTIEPNIKQAFYSIVDPSTKLEVLSSPAYGKPNNNERYIPLLLKDVAGLVPGAADGKGRGNRFLNDLCDADVLIHIIDVSGKTDENGKEVDYHNPAEDIRWLNSEIHDWIYNNIMSKWEYIEKRPKKLFSMFTGYHATNQLIAQAFQDAKLSLRNIEKELPGWNPDVLHRLVDSFIKIRFPMVYVLNKSDCSSSVDNIKLLEKEFSHHFIPVSSVTECFLQNLHKRGAISYKNDRITNQAEMTTEEKNKLNFYEKCVLERFGSSNVLHALNKAVSLKRPSYAFPVRDLTTLLSYDGNRKGHEAGILRDCISLKPGTTIKVLHELLLHHFRLITGNFVRAETLSKNGSVRIVRKEDKIDESNCIIKIMTTKKSDVI